MLYQFKQAVHLCKKDYSRGVHQVSESVELDPRFLKLVQLGLVVEAEASKVISPASMQERSKKLLDKLMVKKAKKAPPKEEPKEEVKLEEELPKGEDLEVEEEESEEASKEESKEESESEPKVKKHAKKKH